MYYRFNYCLFGKLLVKLNDYATRMSYLGGLSCQAGRYMYLNYKKIACGTIFLGVAAHINLANAQQASEETNSPSFTATFVQNQVEQNMSIGRAIKSIVRHYPQEAAGVIETALDLYPDQYKQIIHAAISAQPNLASDVITIALSKGFNCSSIVETAINADPSYVDFIVTAAANSTPGELDEIVRIAVVTEPDSADYIVQSLAREHPSKIVEILTSAIGAVPLVGQYVVEALLAAFPNSAEQVVTTAVRESAAQREQVKKIIETAQNSGVEQGQLEIYAKNGGATQEELAQVLDKRD